MRSVSVGSEGRDPANRWSPSDHRQPKDGLYRAIFCTPLGEARCEVSIVDGFLGGSDPGLQLRGSIHLPEAGRATAIVGLRLPNCPPGCRSIFGHADQLVVVMSGEQRDDCMSLSGALPGVPDAQVLARLELMELSLQAPSLTDFR